MENEQVWHIAYNGQSIGPMSADQLMSYHPTPQTNVWREGMAQWQPIYTIPELMAKLNQGGNPGTPGGGTTPPMPGGAGAGGNLSTCGKEKTAAGLFAILLGSFGIQYFYCGKVAGGFICILLTLVTCGLWSIISLIQGIMMLTMTQQQFEEKYVYSTSAFPLF